MSLLPAADADFAIEVDVAIVGGGGCGLTAALAADEAGASVVVLERDSSTMGTTAMSTGLIPAAGSRQQIAAGIDDDPARFANDILEKTRGETDANIVAELAQASGATIDWLTDIGVPLTLVDSFLYPGHTALRMHGTPKRTGAELMGSLTQGVEQREIPVVTDATVTHLFTHADESVAGVRCERPDGSVEDVQCEAVILACCGFAGSAELVAKYIPEISNATFFGHPGNKGDAMIWGNALGAAIDDIHAYQGHGGLAAGHGIPILWPLIMEGGFQVNMEGQRFSNEARGYSEQAVDVVAQTKHVAYSIYDERLHKLMQEFDDYRDAMEAKAIRTAASLHELAGLIGVPADALAATATAVDTSADNAEPDEFGRQFVAEKKLAAPYYAVRVTGALFHTQGGLRVDGEGRVLRPDNSPLPNIFAGGGAARGISGPSSWGYMAGNGLLTATTFGRLAGSAAAKIAAQRAAA